MTIAEELNFDGLDASFANEGFYLNTLQVAWTVFRQ